MLRTLAVALLALSLALPVSAAERWAFDKAHTQVLFTVDHLGFTELTGRFRVVDGELMLDRDDLARSTVRAVIRADGIDMNDDSLDARLRGPDFFDAANHAELVFTSTRVERVDARRLVLAGDLAMLGQSHPVTLDVTVNFLGDHPVSGRPHAGFTATGRLDRTRWGMGFGAPRVGADIGIRINLEAAPAAD